MPELRQNIATKEWVILATERAKRPEEFVQPHRPLTKDRPVWEAGCPFCLGNEELDLEIMRIPEHGPWQLRVMRNKYPALQLAQARIGRRYPDTGNRVRGPREKQARAAAAAADGGPA